MIQVGDELIVSYGHDDIPGKWVVVTRIRAYDGLRLYDVRPVHDHTISEADIRSIKRPDGRWEDV